jgi:hypothetical protein
MILFCCVQATCTLLSTNILVARPGGKKNAAFFIFSRAPVSTDSVSAVYLDPKKIEN